MVGHLIIPKLYLKQEAMWKKAILIVLICITARGAGIAQEASSMYHYDPTFTIDRSNFVDTIPIIYENSQVYLTLNINGKPHLFNLDTGSSQGVLYEGEQIEYSEPLGYIDTRDANGGIDTIPMVRFPDFDLGHLHITGYKGIRQKRAKGRYRYDGIIGFDLFNRGLQAKIDTKRGYLIVTDKKHYFDKEPGFELKYKLQRWVPYLKLNTFLNHEEPTLFDTGAEELYAFNKESFDTERYKDARVVSLIEETTNGQWAIGSFGAEKSALMFYIHLDHLGWGNFSFRDIHTLTTQGDSRLGGEILQYGTFVINPKRKRIKFWSYTGGDSVTISNEMVDITYVPIDGRPVVGTIRHRSKQYAAGFRQGDIITSINGTKISTMADFQGYHFVKGERYTFGLHSTRGFDKEVTIEDWGK